MDEHELADRLLALERRLAALERRQGGASSAAESPPESESPQESESPPESESLPESVSLSAPESLRDIAQPPAAAEGDLGPVHVPWQAVQQEAAPCEERQPIESDAARKSPKGVGTRPDVSARAPARTGDLEEWVATVLLGRIGIGAVLLAASYFAQLAYRNVSPLTKVLSLYALAAAMIGAGQWLRSRVSDRFVALLWGGGIAVSYMAALVATMLYHLVDPWVGLALAAGAAALGQELARRLQVPALAVIAIGSAQLAPLLLGLAQGGSYNVLVYLALVHFAGVVLEQRWGWSQVRITGLLGAVLCAFVWRGFTLLDEAGPGIAVQFFVLALLLPDLFVVWRGRAVASWVAQALWGVLGLAAIDAALVARRVEPVAFAWLSVATASTWIALASFGARRTPEPGVSQFRRALAAVGCGLLVLGVSLAAWRQWPGSDRNLTLYFAAVTGAGLLALWVHRQLGGGEGAVLLAAGRSLVGATSGAARGGLLLPVLLPIAGLAAMVLARAPWKRALGLCFAAATAHAMCWQMASGSQNRIMPAARLHEQSGWLALALVCAAAILFVGAALARRRSDRTSWVASVVGFTVLALLWVPHGLLLPRLPGFGFPLDPHMWSALFIAAAAIAAACWRRPQSDPATSTLRLLLALGVALVLFAGGREVFLLTRHMEGAFPAVLMSVYLLVAAGVLLAVGFGAQAASLRWTAMAVFAGVVCKVGVHDLAGASLPLRVLVTGVLGFVLLASAYTYSRRSRAI